MKTNLTLLAVLVLPCAAISQDAPPETDRGPVKEGPVWSDDFEKTVIRLPPEKEIEAVTKVETVKGVTPPAPIPCDKVGKKIKKVVTGDLATLEGALILAKYDDGILFRVEKVALSSWSGFGFLDFPVFINQKDLPEDIRKAVGGFDPAKAKTAHVHRFATCQEAGIYGFPGVYGPKGESVITPWTFNGNPNPLIDPFGDDSVEREERAMTYDELQRWLADLRKKKEQQGKAKAANPKR